MLGHLHGDLIGIKEACIVANTISRATIVFCAIALWVDAFNVQIVDARPKPPNSHITFSVALSWLPADTETLIVANGPFLMPRSFAANDETQNRSISRNELIKEFEELPIDLVGLEKGLLEKYLNGREIALAMEGSRHFRSPSELGEMPYEGCDIVIFAGDVANLGDAFMKDSQNVATSFEEIQGQRVATFQSKLEEDVWTTLVAFPKPNVLVVATNRDYLRDILARIAGQTGPRALPAELPEWKYVNTHAHCWGLRHYDKSQANLDPSSPFGGEKSANFPDDKAIGLIFNFDPAQGRTATITYLSDAKDILPIVQKGLFPATAAWDPVLVKDLNIRYLEIAPGVVQGSFDLLHSEPASFFFLCLLAAFGHGVYV
jgi:hypothetical protein